MPGQALNPLVTNPDDMTSEQISLMLNGHDLLVRKSLGQVTFRRVAYLRISKDKAKDGRGAGLGVMRQFNELKEAEPDIEFWYVDNDRSAWSGKARDDYDTMCADIQSGVIEAKGATIWTMYFDRLNRDSDKAKAFSKLCWDPRSHDRDVKVDSPGSGRADFKTANGKHRFRVDASESEKYSDLIAERVGKKWRQKVEAGEPLSGMRRFGTKEGGTEWEPEEAKAIQDGAKMILNGKSLSDVARMWNDRGFRTVKAGNRFNIHNTRGALTRHHTAGKILWHGKVYPGNWKPILDEQTWDSVRAKLAGNKPFFEGSQRITWLGTGLYKCGVCGDRMFVGGDQYRCKSKRPEREPDGRRHTTRMAKPFDEMIERMLLAALRSESLDGDLADGRTPDTDASGLRERKAELQTQIDEYRGLVGTPGWGPKEIGGAVAKLTEQISAIDVQLTPTLVPSLTSQIASPGLTDEEWGKLTVETKRALLSEMVTVTLLPTPKGNRIHQDPADYVSLEWAS